MGVLHQAIQYDAFFFEYRDNFKANYNIGACMEKRDRHCDGETRRNGRFGRRRNIQTTDENSQTQTCHYTIGYSFDCQSKI